MLGSAEEADNVKHVAIPGPFEETALDDKTTLIGECVFETGMVIWRSKGPKFLIKIAGIKPKVAILLVYWKILKRTFF